MIIRSNSISDSGAAALGGVHPSTVSRWKCEHPELVIALLQAREQFRDHHLSLMKASEAKGGWRAAAWLLERIFPADYHTKAAERERFQKMQGKEAEQYQSETEPAPAPKPAPVVQASLPAATTTPRPSIADSSPSIALSQSQTQRWAETSISLRR